MEDLRDLLSDLGASDVKTYIQSGSAVFRSEEPDTSKLEDEILDEVERRYGLAPRVLLLSCEELGRAVEGNPFPEAESEPKSLHLFFLTVAPIRPDVPALENLRSGTESFMLDGRVFYLHAPDGIGRSELAANVEKLLSVPATARNWRTVSKVAEMVDEYG